MAACFRSSGSAWPPVPRWLWQKMSGTNGTFLLYRHYRNTDKSHAFERDTAVGARPATGLGRKADKVEGARDSRIHGDNVRQYRKRVQRFPGDSG